MDNHNMRKMAAHDAFLFIAKAWDKPKLAYAQAGVIHASKRVYGVRIIKPYKSAAWGICACIWFLDANKYLFSRTPKKMTRLLNDYKEQKGIMDIYYPFYFPTSRAGARKRAALCRELAKKC